VISPQESGDSVDMEGIPFFIAQHSLLAEDEALLGPKAADL
jgi:hypothetical protein